MLKLSSACLSFDFIGNSTDESSDDLSTVQIPTGWRPLFREFSTVQLFFGLFHSLPSKLAAIVSLYKCCRMYVLYYSVILLLKIYLFILQAVSCLVQLASARRSLFSAVERAQYLEQLVKGVQGILDSPQVN